MYLQFKTKSEFLTWVQDNILTPQEVQELLGVSQQSVNQSVQGGKLKVLKKQARTTLFLKEDVLARKAELGPLREKYRPYDE